MILVPEHAHRARLGLLIFVLGFAFVFVALVAPIGLFAVPLAALLLASPDRPTGVVIATSFAGGIGLWWLWNVGDPAEQLVRAGCVIATAAYLVLSTTTKWAVIHRALVSVILAGIGAAMTVRVLDLSWDEIIWWTERRAVIAQSYIMQIWLAGQPDVGSGIDDTAAQMETFIAGLPDLVTNLFPATFAVQMMAGLSLATYAVARMGIQVPGVAVRRFDEFRFSEHLGWPVVFALGIALFVDQPALRIPAINILMLAGVLYGLRGVAIAWFYWQRRSGSRILLGTMAVLAVLFLWRVMIPAIIILGLIDTGLDLRQRMKQSK